MIIHQAETKKVRIPGKKTAYIGEKQRNSSIPKVIRDPTRTG
jgi:hypothetical protein